MPIKLKNKDGLMEIVVEIENKGSRITRFNYADNLPPLILRKVNANNQKISFSDKKEYKPFNANNPDNTVTGTTIRPGTTERVPFILQLEKGELYLITFVVPLTKFDRIISDIFRGFKKAKSNWIGRKFISV